MYLRHKRRNEQMPADDTEREAGPRQDADLSGLKFRSTVTDEELEREGQRYESELWKDL
jgi:hypothetical protein